MIGQLEEMKTTSKIMIGQLEEMKNTSNIMSAQLEEMKQTSAQTDKSIKAAERLAAASEAQVMVSQKTAKQQLRAYLSVSPRPIKNFGPDRPTEVGIVIKNNGQTPAYETDQVVGLFVEKYPLPPDIQFNFKGNTKGPVAVIFPDHTGLGTTQSPRAYRSDEISKIKDRTMALYIVGRVNYRDIFEEWHFTNFCFIHDGVSETMESCNRHNDVN